MKNTKIYIVALVAVAVGLFLGWLLFKNPNVADNHIHTENNTETEVWTCSMHPQIRQNEPGVCPICGMDLIPASQAGSGSEYGFQMTEDAVKLANIQTTIIGATSNEGNLKLNGKIQANETQSASIVAHIPGRIEKLYISYTGEQVNKGQKIATIYSPELITAQKELIEAQKIKDVSPGLLEAAKNKLKFWKISDKTIEDILNSGVVRETFIIYADHSGTVSQKRVAVGDYMATGEVLFDLQNLNSLWAIFDVYENDLPYIKVGNIIDFTTPSAPNKKFKAKITFINPVIDPNTRAATIRAEVNNATGKLKPEMFIAGALQTVGNKNELTVPKSAVLWTGTRSVVYVKNAEAEVPTFEYREVALGEATQNGYNVVKGLEGGEEVVTNGAFVIDASAQLNNQKSMMNKNVQIKNAVTSNKLPDYTALTPIIFKEQLTTLVTTYIDLKDALVADESKKASQYAKELVEKANNIDMTQLKGAAHVFWMGHLKTIQSHAEKIIESTDIEEQRKQFDFLSQALIKSIKVFGVSGAVFYVQHCPMANNNYGADWLSVQSEVKNPYFGDKMMKCGSITDTIN
ncbi:MAG: efflux RND transporter periplasmic adaptor subunit [Chitinophagales bacterium]|nr:efflux RND transporter periplasmic adaptor subunit [Bacteroidota bacterium]MCB9226868.1 efflux RND transporter periplasmic adaptor subunit [Chitinophagales bacterium]